MISPERRARLSSLTREMAEDLDLAMPYLLSRGISKEAAQMFGLGYQSSSNRVSIPYQTPAGVVTIKLRCADMSHGEHKDSPCPKFMTAESGLGLHLYNAQCLIRADGLVVVTEGELDAICVQAYCGIPAVAYPGVDTWLKQPHWPLCFEGVPEVVVVADGDKVGRQAASRVAESIGYSARVVSMPDGEDPNSFIVKNGVPAFTERLNK